MTTYQTRKRSSAVNARARSLRDGDNVGEALLWSELKARRLGGYKFVRQFPVGPYFADLLCRERRLVVEVDGAQHAGSEYDERRNEFMRKMGYAVLRFWSHDVAKQRDSVCETILAALEGRLVDDVSAPDLRYVAHAVTGMTPLRFASQTTSPQRGEEMPGADISALSECEGAASPDFLPPLGGGAEPGGEAAVSEAERGITLDARWQRAKAFAEVNRERKASPSSGCEE